MQSEISADCDDDLATLSREEREHRQRMQKIAGMSPEEKRREIAKIEKRQSGLWNETETATGPQKNGRRLAVIDEDAYLPPESDESRLLSIIAEQAIKLPTGISRAWFTQAVASVVIAAIKEGAIAGSTNELFEGGYSRSEMELAARLLAELIDSNNPRLQAKCLAFVFGLRGESETAIARDEGVNKATVSKRCVRLKQVFALHPARGMKSEAAVRSYSKRQTGKRARPKPIAWSWSGLLQGVINNVSATPATA